VVIRRFSFANIASLDAQHAGSIPGGADPAAS